MIEEIFERNEIKYIMTNKQYETLMSEIRPYLVESEYPHSDTTSIYYDTDDYRLIRAALEHREYREKLRLRGYGKIDSGSLVFMEMKKKYEGVTYKRRQPVIYEQTTIPEDTQINREIGFLFDYYSLKPKVLINYQRDSWDWGNTRITFDRDVKFETSFDSLKDRAKRRLTDDDMVIMEVKCRWSMPYMLADILDKMKLYPGHFSKYGTIYSEYICGEAKSCWNYYRTNKQLHSLPIHPVL